MEFVDITYDLNKDLYSFITASIQYGWTNTSYVKDLLDDGSLRIGCVNYLMGYR